MPEHGRRILGRAMGGMLFALGVAMVALTLARGGGPLAVGILIGVAFALLGALRFRAAGGSG